MARSTEMDNAEYQQYLSLSHKELAKFEPGDFCPRCAVGKPLIVEDDSNTLYGGRPDPWPPRYWHKNDDNPGFKNGCAAWRLHSVLNGYGEKLARFEAEIEAARKMKNAG